MVDITEISAIVAAAGVLVGVVYYILDMRNQAKLRQTDMVMRLYDKFGSTEFQKAYQKMMHLEFEDYSDYTKRYGENADVRAAFMTVNVFFEGMGLLVKRKLAGIDLVDDLLSSDILSTWQKMKPLAEGDRKKSARPQAWEWFEYLYNEMKKREQKLQEGGKIG
jgi:hypothetical protein